MDIANTLKGLLPKIGFTWNTLLRLFYSLCGWLVVGTLIPITGASGHTPVGTLRRLRPFHASGGGRLRRDDHVDRAVLHGLRTGR